MSCAKVPGLLAALSLLAGISQVSAHGFVSGITIGGKYYQGFNPSSYPWHRHDPPKVIGWTYDAPHNEHVLPNQYGSGDIVCGKNGSPGATHATVAAGSTVELQWNQWPDSHHGPVIDYMARCNGMCEKVDKMDLKFFKIYESGLVKGAPLPGSWASDKLIANGRKWWVKIPPSLAPGNYVLRHEIIALHSAHEVNGAQNYPQCINLKVTGSGDLKPRGVRATEFYSPRDPGIFINIYSSVLKSYDIPGPRRSNVYSRSLGAEVRQVAEPESTPADESPAYGDEIPAQAEEGPTPAASPVEPSTTVSVIDLAASTTDEQTTTITSRTTITLTTTVGASTNSIDASSTPNDPALTPTPVSSPSYDDQSYEDPSYEDAYAPWPTTTPKPTTKSTCRSGRNSTRLTPTSGTVSTSALFDNSTLPTPSAAPFENSTILAPLPTSTSVSASAATFENSALPTPPVAPYQNSTLPTSSAAPFENSTLLDPLPTSTSKTASPSPSTPTSPTTSDAVIPSLISAIASAIESAAAPTSSAEAAEGPEAGLPGNMTLQDFIEWLTQLIEQYFGKGKPTTVSRRHARDIGS